MSLPTPNTRKEQYLNAIATGDSSGLPTPITREEEYLEAIARNGGGGGGTTNYNALDNKPQIAGTTLQGDKSLAELGIASASAVSDSEKDIYAVMGEMGAKNLIQYPYVSSGNNYYQINDDGTITLKGTNTSVQWLRVSDFYLKPGKYIMTASPSGNAYGITIGIGSLNAQDEYTPIASTTHPNFSTTFSINAYTKVRVRLYRAENLDFTNNVVLYPMLRLASDTDDTYEPYAKTNKQLTDDVATNTEAITANTSAIEAITDVYGAKNLADIKSISGGQELTWTLNSDKTVTVSGTLATRTYDHVGSQVFSLKAGTYILSKNPMTSAVIPFTSMSLTNSNGSVSYCEVSEEEEEKEFVLASDAEVRIWLNCVGQGSTFNVTFYPMIRDARITDPTYVPYAMTNRELTNLFEFRAVTLTTDGSGNATLFSGYSHIVANAITCILTPFWANGHTYVNVKDLNGNIKANTEVTIYYCKINYEYTS